MENACHDSDLYITNTVFQYFKRRRDTIHSPCDSKRMRLIDCGERSKSRNVRLNFRVLDDPGTKVAYNVEVNKRFKVSTR